MSSIAPSGVPIPVAQNASSPGGLVALKRNNLNPRLTVFPDRLVYNIIAETELPFADISSVGVEPGISGPVLRISCRGHALDYVGILASQADLAHLLGLLEGHVPLTEAARSFEPHKKVGLSPAIVRRMLIGVVFVAVAVGLLALGLTAVGVLVALLSVG